MRIVLAGDHVTALPAESMDNCPADFLLTGGDFEKNFPRIRKERGMLKEVGLWVPAVEQQTAPDDSSPEDGDPNEEDE